MTLPEAARDLGVARSTLYAQIALGKLRATKTGRDWSISIEEVIETALAGWEAEQ